MNNLITLTQTPTQMQGLLASMNDLMTATGSKSFGIVEEESSFSQSGSGKLIDKYLKKDLVKIAKQNDVSLKSRDGKMKTKEQLFKSLKRKKLV